MTNQNKKADIELRTAAIEFIEAFRDAIAKSDEEAAQILEAGNFSLFEGGLVSLTATVTQSLSRLKVRAVKLLGSAFGNEDEIEKTAYSSVQASFLNDTPIAQAATELIDSLFEPADFEFVVPNHLLRFSDNVRSVTIGPVKAALAEDFSCEFKERFPTSSLNISIGSDFKFTWSANPPKFNVEIHPITWIVNVSAANANVEEEAKWLIDIAVSFLRLHYKEARGYFQ